MNKILKSNHWFVITFVFVAMSFPLPSMSINRPPPQTPAALCENAGGRWTGVPGGPVSLTTPSYEMMYQIENIPVGFSKVVEIFIQLPQYPEKPGQRPIMLKDLKDRTDPSGFVTYWGSAGDYILLPFGETVFVRVPPKFKVTISHQHGIVGACVKVNREKIPPPPPPGGGEEPYEESSDEEIPPPPSPGSTGEYQKGGKATGRQY